MPPRTQTRDPRSDLGAFLGQELKEIRQVAGYSSQDELATALNKDRSVVGKAETGEYPPVEAVLKDWLDLCGVNGRVRTMLEGMARVARAGQGPVKVWVAPWIETEAKAHTLRYWAPVLVPGLVQTPAYARELFLAMGFDDRKVADYLEVRLGRQAIMERAFPPDITVVLWEPVLHHQIGTPETMRDQLDRLVELGSQPPVTIHVLPSTVGANPGLGGPINLAASDDTPELFLSDGLVEDRPSQDPFVVRQARTTFNSVRADALTRAASRDLIMEAIERWSQ